MFGVDAYPTFAEKAAALISSVAQNHALFDGNKRISLYLTFIFIRLNGYEVTFTNDEAFDFVLDVAQSRLTCTRSHRSSPHTLQKTPQADTRGRPWDTGRTMRFIIRVVVNAFALWVVTLILPCRS